MLFGNEVGTAVAALVGYAGIVADAVEANLKV